YMVSSTQVLGQKGWCTMRMRIICGMVFAAVCCEAQTRDTGAIFGAVMDAQGAALSGATVTLTATGTAQARQGSANTAGQFTYASLPVGLDAITAEHPGFSRQEQTGIRLQANENIRVDLTLQIGDVKTTIAVEALSSQVDLRSSTIKETVDQQRVVELPLN